MRFGTNIGSLNVINHVDYHGKAILTAVPMMETTLKNGFCRKSVNDCLIFIGIFFLRKQHYSS